VAALQGETLSGLGTEGREGYEGQSGFIADGNVYWDGETYGLATMVIGFSSFGSSSCKNIDDSYFLHIGSAFS
jgi:hypothetical protein